MSGCRCTILLLTLVLGTIVEAQSQWQPCQPNASLCQTGGNVGIGTSNPSQALDVNGNILAQSFGVGGPAPTGYQFFATTSSLGISSAIQLRSSFTGAAVSYIGNFGNYGTVLSQNRDPQNGTLVEAAIPPNQKNAAHLQLGDNIRHRLLQVTNYPGGQETVRLLIDDDGNVGIGTLTPAQRLDVTGNISASGNITANGNIAAKYQDVAEWVPATADLEPGTVVVLNPNRDNEIMPSTRPYDTTVAGVVSAQPGLTLGEESATKETVATMGRVRVRVDARHAPIAIGDLLVTSDQPGYAMKSIPVELAGMSMHRPGTIIGKALQPLARGEGEILVLLSMQ